MNAKEAREKFGLLVKDARSKKGLNRDEFAELVGVKGVVIIRMEHGVVNPTRLELVRALEILELAEKEENQAYELLRIFSPLRRKRIKFHLPFNARVRRHPRSYN